MASVTHFYIFQVNLTGCSRKCAAQFRVAKLDKTVSEGDGGDGDSSKEHGEQSHGNHPQEIIISPASFVIHSFISDSADSSDIFSQRTRSDSSNDGMDYIRRIHIVCMDVVLSCANCGIVDKQLRHRDADGNIICFLCGKHRSTLFISQACRVHAGDDTL